MRETGYGSAQEIQPNWDVYDSGGDKIGNVAEVTPSYILLTKGWLTTKEVYVPLSAVQSVEEGRAYLNVAKDELDAQGWDQPPSETGISEAEGLSASAQGTEQYADTDQYRDTAVYGTSGYGDASASTETDTARVQRIEEDLAAEKTTAQTGEVRVRKDVTEEEQALDVPVTREEVRVRSTAVDRPAAETDASLGQGEEIRVPVREEQVQVTKQPRVVEELEIEKVGRQDTERVSDTVRREQVHVEDEGHVRRAEDDSAR